MDSALVLAALLMGLAGAPHCVAMCGTACNLLSRPSDGATGLRAIRPMMALHAGRIVGYATLGAVVAASVASLGSLSVAAPIVRPLWTLLHVAAVALGVWLAWQARAPAWLSTAPAQIAAIGGPQVVRVFRALPAAARSGIAGAMWVAVPCGLLQSALLVAALGSNAAAGAAVMAAFAVASTSGLVLAQHLWRFLRRDEGRRAAAASIRLAGVLLAGSSLFALWHGLGAAICAAIA